MAGRQKNAAERLLIELGWSGYALGQEQVVTLSIWFDGSNIRLEPTYQLGERVWRWSFNADGNADVSLSPFSPLSMDLSIVGWSRSERVAAFDLTIGLNVGVRLSLAAERVVLALPPRTGEEGLPKSPATLEDLYTAFRALGTATDEFDEEFAEFAPEGVAAGGRRKCYASRNCVGRAYARQYIHCHNCRKKASGKSLGKSSEDPDCENC